MEDGSLKPKRANESGSSPTICRWFVETPAGWLGAWNVEAFDAAAKIARAPLEAELEHCKAAAALATKFGDIDIEQMLAECLPGGQSCDPQEVADNIRRYCNSCGAGRAEERRALKVLHTWAAFPPLRAGSDLGSEVAAPREPQAM